MYSPSRNEKSLVENINIVPISVGIPIITNAIKYLMRYGKKQGRNEKDLYKAIHYIVLLISSERGKQRVTRNEKGTSIGELYNPRHN